MEREGDRGKRGKENNIGECGERVGGEDKRESERERECKRKREGREKGKCKRERTEG